MNPIKLVRRKVTTPSGCTNNSPPLEGVGSGSNCPFSILNCPLSLRRKIDKCFNNEY